MLYFFPSWIIRFIVTMLVVWLVWAFLIAPSMFSSASFIELRYQWMLPEERTGSFFGLGF